MKTVARFGTAAGAMLVAGAAATAVPGESREALQPLLACRAETDAVARLACYDKAADALRVATERRDIVVVDKAEVQKARRSLFGFSLPSLKLFGNGDAADVKRTPTGIDTDLDEITTTIRSARQDGDGNWVITMEDGAVWQQTGGVIAITPKPGGQVTIRRATLGSFFLRVGKANGVKARRVG